MYLELNLADQTKSEKEIVTASFKETNIAIKTIFTLTHYAGKIRDLFANINISCPVDYPYGLGETSLRQHDCLSAIRHGANCIDLVVNPVYLTNGKKHELVEDLKTIKQICDDKNVELRVMLDYRMYQDGLNYNICSVVHRLGIKYVIPSTGQFAEDLTDNIIFCGLIANKNPGLKTILNHNYCTQEQFNKIPKTIYGIRLKSFKFGV